MNFFVRKVHLLVAFHREIGHNSIYSRMLSIQPITAPAVTRTGLGRFQGKGVIMDVHMRVVQGRPRGKYLRFPEGEFVFGRGPECHVRPNSHSVSRQHCLVRVNADGVVIRDLGSTNGTLVNGTRVVEECTLKDGDYLQFGPLVLQLVIGEIAARHENTPPPRKNAKAETQIHFGDTDDHLPVP
jgi:pSer/pThr/pTyr-binding forkhead associated (FHA) protein